MKTLNLDSLGAKDKRELVLNGKSHEIKSMSVKTFIATTKIIENLKDDQSAAGQIGGTVAIIRQNVPTVSEDELLCLSLEQLKVLMEFVRGEDPEEIAEHDEVIEGAAAVDSEGK